MKQQISVTAPIASLIGDLQDISSSLAAANPPAKSGLRDYQLAAVDHVRAASNQTKRTYALGRAAIRCLPLEKLDTLLAPVIAAGALRTHYERITGATEYRDQMGNLLALTVGGRHFCKTGALGDMADQLAAGIAIHEALLTLPAPGQSSTEGLYIQQVGRVPRPTQSLAMGLQHVGRIKRQMECSTCAELTTSPVLGLHGYVCRPCKANEPVHAHLVNPMTGEKIEGSDFTIGGDK